MFDRREEAVLNCLLNDGVIFDYPYQITESQVQAYVAKYSELYSRPNGVGVKTKSNLRFARKLAGRTLIAHTQSVGMLRKDVKAGLVYLIQNPAYESHLKVGMCLDIHDRLKVYQTYDPFRQYSILHYEFVLDKRTVERHFIKTYRLDLMKGEWIDKIDAVKFHTGMKQFI